MRGFSKTILTGNIDTMAARPSHLSRRQRTASAELFRPAAGSRNEHGEWTRGAFAAAESIDVYDWPDKGRWRDIEEGGARIRARRRVETAKKLRARQDDRDGDIIKLDGEFWRAIEAARYTRDEKRNVAGTISTDRIYEALIERLDDQSVPTGKTVPDIPQPGAGDLARDIRRYVALGADLATTDSDGDVTAQDVIPANGPGPLPSGLFATVLLRQFEQQAYRSLAYDSGGNETVLTQMECIASIQFFREGAADAAQKLISWIESSAGHDEEHKKEFAIVMPEGGFQWHRLDEAVSSAFEERVVMDIPISYVHSTERSRGYLQTSEIEITHDPDGTAETVSVDDD